MKRKTGLSLLFTCLAFASGAMAQERSSVPDPETAKILSSVGMTYDEAKQAANGLEVWAFYDPDNGAGEAFSLKGVDGSCGVSWSVEGEGLASGFTEADRQLIGLKYNPAIDRDIEKISMLHEIAHCLQSDGAKDNEYNADEKALTHYLARGGSKEVAQYWIYWRGLSPLLYPGKYAKSENYTPTMGPRLQAKFFGGETPDIGKTRAAYDELLAVAKDYTPEGRKPGARIIDEMLADDTLQISTDARKLLQFYADACRYLSEGPQRPAAPVKLPVLKV